MQWQFIDSINRKRSLPRPPWPVCASTVNGYAKLQLRATLRRIGPLKTDLCRYVSTQLTRLNAVGWGSWPDSSLPPVKQNS